MGQVPWQSCPDQLYSMPVQALTGYDYPDLSILSTWQCSTQPVLCPCSQSATHLTLLEITLAIFRLGMIYFPTCQPARPKIYRHQY